MVETPVLVERLERYLTTRYHGAQVSDMAFLASGWECDVYAFALALPNQPPLPLVLRLYRREDAVPRIRREEHGLRLLRGVGYPVPVALLSETDRVPLGHPFALQERLAGGPLWPRLANAAPTPAERMLDHFAALLATLHRQDWTAFTPDAAIYQSAPHRLLEQVHADARRFYVESDLPGFLPVVDWLEANQSAIVVRPAVVHLDFHANNVLVDEQDRWTVIDWTQVGVSDFRADLSWTLLIMGEFGQPWWREYLLDAYQRAASLRVDSLEYFDVMSYAKNVADDVLALRAKASQQAGRAEAALAVAAQAPVLRRFLQRIRQITRLTLPEAEELLRG